MARITPEQIEQINEVYADCHTKSKTAKIVGVSVASVTKYLIEGYIPKSQRQVDNFESTIYGVENFAKSLCSALDNRERFLISYSLNDKEWEDLRELQKEIY